MVWDCIICTASRSETLESPWRYNNGSRSNIGVRDQFLSLFFFFFFFGGGGGAEVSCPKIKWFCPNVTCLFLPENCYLKYSRGGGGGYTALLWQKEASDKSAISCKRAKCVCHFH